MTDYNRYDERIRVLADRTGIEWPPTGKGVHMAKKRRKQKEAEGWLTCETQGQGVKDFKGDRIGNAWLSNPGLLKSA